MEFKVFLLCFVVLVVATSAASVCKCEDKKQSVSKYKVKVKDGDKEFEEEVEIDTKEQTETYRIPKTDSGNAGEVDVVYDFKTNLTMQRLSAAKACFLSEFTENIPKPSDLVKIFDQKSATTTIAINETNSEYEVVSTVTDRSVLSDEMASLCAKLPIYRVKKTTPLTLSVRRVKRCPRYYCYWYYYPCCGYSSFCRCWTCWTCSLRRCVRVC